MSELGGCGGGSSPGVGGAKMELRDEVRCALYDRRPIVALESTIISHGLPYPDNVELALELEDSVRTVGAVPATIAVLGGKARVGLGEAEIEELARAGADVGKAAAGDLAAYLATGRSAATTVSATAFIAARAGIKLFATGGIGGVHRGDSGDVSADLSSLAELDIAVVSAGPKAILDLPRTVEMLETLGVLVIGYGTSELPAFYTRESGIELYHRADDPAELAAILHCRFDELSQGGVLIANPIDEASALPAGEMEAVIAAALAAAAAERIRGKPLTPFLLAHIAAATGRRAVLANRALAVSNARLAAEVAIAYAGK
jgi:pseudouridine-5'-phosphate glycosidase